MKTASICPMYIDENEKDVIYVVLYYLDNEVVKRFAFRDHVKAEESSLSWTKVLTPDLNCV